MAVGHPSCVHSSGDTYRLLRLGLGFHIQEGVKPEDLGASPDHPIVCQRRYPRTRENDGVLTVGVW